VPLANMKAHHPEHSVLAGPQIVSPSIPPLLAPAFSPILPSPSPLLPFTPYCLCHHHGLTMTPDNSTRGLRCTSSPILPTTTRRSP
jgi:hypothetical protein